MDQNDININDIPFAELLGLKKKELTQQQKIGKKFLDIAKEHPTTNQLTQ